MQLFTPALFRREREESIGPRELTDICSNDMLMCMRTTLNLDDQLVKAVKRAALESGRTMTQVIEEALRETLVHRGAERRAGSYRLRLPTVKGKKKPGVDLTDRDSLFEIMEGRS